MPTPEDSAAEAVEHMMRAVGAINQANALIRTIDRLTATQVRAALMALDDLQFEGARLSSSWERCIGRAQGPQLPR